MTTRRWIKYEGRKYDVMEATQRATIGDLLELHRDAGMSVRKISTVLTGLADMKSILDIYDEPARLEVWSAMLFLCLRKAGRREFTWDDALSVSLVDIALDIETPEEGAGDPKVSDPPTPGELDGEATTTS